MDRRLLYALVGFTLLVGGISGKEGTCEADECSESNDKKCDAGLSPELDIHLTIYSYQRPRHLLNLLKDIAVDAENAKKTVQVHVIDDNSFDCIYPAQDFNPYESKDFMYEYDLFEPMQQEEGSSMPTCPSRRRFDAVLSFMAEQKWRFFTSRHRHGKKRFWHLVAQAYSLLRSVKASYYYFLPDDDRLCHNFFNKSIDIWQGIPSLSKMTLMLHIEPERKSGSQWTSFETKKLDNVYQIGWVESGNFLCEARFLETMQYTFPRIATDRWNARPELSSGVGSTLSEIVHKRRFHMFRSEDSLLAHVGNEDSKMNPALRKQQPLRTYNFIDGPDRLKELEEDVPRVDAVMASKWARMRSLQRTIYSLAPQVDCVHIYLNSYEFVPPFLLSLSWVDIVSSEDAKGDIGDSGKFYWSGRLGRYVFICDDDNIYPPDYVQTMIDFLEKFEPPVAVGVHGATMLEHKLKPSKGSSFGFYDSRKVYMGVETVERQEPVNILSTGLCLYRAQDFPQLKVEEFKIPNMADVWFAIHAKDRKIPLIVMPHEGGWIKTVKGTMEESIYETLAKRKTRSAFVTDAAIKAMPWTIHTPKPKPSLSN